MQPTAIHACTLSRVFHCACLFPHFPEHRLDADVCTWQRVELFYRRIRLIYLLTFDLCLKKAVFRPPTNILCVFGVKFNAKVEEACCKQSSHEANYRSQPFRTTRNIWGKFTLSVLLFHCFISQLVVDVCNISNSPVLLLFVIGDSIIAASRTPNDTWIFALKFPPDQFVSTFKISKYIQLKLSFCIRIYGQHSLWSVVFISRLISPQTAAIPDIFAQQ